MNTLYERLLEICRDGGIEKPKNRDIQALIGVSSGRVTQIKQEREAASISEESMSRVLRKGYRRDWVKSGIGHKFINHPTKSTPSPNTAPGPDLAGLVPLISWVRAGAWSEIIDPLAPGDAEEWLPCPVAHGRHTFALVVRGESMHNPHGRPSFQDGDLIFVDPEREARHGSLVVVRLDDQGEATFKRLIVEGERHFLKALNPAWPEPMLEINGNATVCGVVIFKGEVL